MASKRKRTHSSASPAAVKVEDTDDHSLVSESTVGNADHCASDNDVIVITDDKEPLISSEGTKNSAVPAEGEDDRFINVEPCLERELMWVIKTVVHEPVAIRDAICHLSKLLTNAKWNAKNTLSTASGHAITIVAFSSLASVNLAITRGKATTLSISMDLLRDIDVEKLRSLYNLAQVSKPLALGRLAALRTSADPRSRIMNVYDLTKEQLFAELKDRLHPLSTNSLIGGDVIRMDVHCVCIRVAGTFDMQFKLKAAHLLLPVPRTVDILS